MSENIWLKVQLDKIESKIDKLDDRIDNVDVTLAKQSVTLDDHTRRSLANEEQVEMLKTKLEAEIKPLQNHVAMMTGAFKFIGVVSSCVSLIYGLIKLISLF